jgi:CubicO group peptidase (beta-lactamase class C family)
MSSRVRRWPLRLLVGLALERAPGMPVATYLERKLWQPLGMEADGSWSVDNRRSGFEKMESGLNGRAIDFAKLGVLYANGASNPLLAGDTLCPDAMVPVRLAARRAVGQLAPVQRAPRPGRRRSTAP